MRTILRTMLRTRAWQRSRRLLRERQQPFPRNREIAETSERSPGGAFQVASDERVELRSSCASGSWPKKSFGSRERIKPLFVASQSDALTHVQSQRLPLFHRTGSI